MNGNYFIIFIQKNPMKRQLRDLNMSVIGYPMRMYYFIGNYYLGDVRYK